MKQDQLNETIWRIESGLDDLQRDGLGRGSGSAKGVDDPTLRVDLQQLTTDFNSFKTTITEEVDKVKTEFSAVNNNVDVLTAGLEDLATVSQLSESRSSRALEELSALRSSVSALQELQEMNTGSKEDFDILKTSITKLQEREDDGRLNQVSIK